MKERFDVLSFGHFSEERTEELHIIASSGQRHL